MKKHLLLSLILFLFCIYPAALLAQWTSAVSISPGSNAATLNENMGPCIATSGDTVHAVYSDKVGSNYIIYYTHSVDTGNTWSAPVPLTSLNAKATMPVIAAWGSGVHVVWMDSLNGLRASYYRRSLDGGSTWSTITCVDTNTLFWPGVACHGPLVLISLDKGTFGVNTEVWLSRSTDNGNTWSAEQQISNASGRSEDQHTFTDGKHVHITWNDNRSGTMQIYYRHSADGGVTWGAETAVAVLKSYTTMVSQSGPYVDVAYGNQSTGTFDVFLAQSSDTGSTWSTPNNTQVTNTSSTHEAYPYMIRDGMNLYIVYRDFTNGPTYIRSSNGGATWSAPFGFGTGGQPFIAMTGNCMLHVIYLANNKVQYTRNRIATCQGTSSVNEQGHYGFSLYPNPSSSALYLNSTEDMDGIIIDLYDINGKKIIAHALQGRNHIIDTKDLPSGIYQARFTKNGISVYSARIVRE